jgi:predicted phage terminase large subunit-like protein
MFPGSHQTPARSNIFAQARAEELLRNWKLTPATFAYKMSRGNWIPKEFLLKVSMRIAQAIARGNGRLIVSWPPRHGKSELITVNTPLWTMENFPGKQIVICSYGADLSTDFGRKIRDMITDPDNEELLDAKLRKDSKRLAKFMMEDKSTLTSVGIGGPITGRGADVLLLDDYIKSIKEAESQVQRDFVYNWFTTTAMSRLEPGATVIIVATRWHKDDLIGRLLKDFGDQWEYIRLPAIAEAGDPIGRPEGTPLFPERQSMERLQEQKRLLGSFYFNAIYQQDPQAEEDKKASKEWLRATDEVPNRHEWMWARAWDFAGTFGQGDYSCGMLLGYHPPTRRVVVDNILRKRLGPRDLKQLVRQTAEIDGLEVPVLIEQEPGSSGKAVIEHYTNDVLPEFRVAADMTAMSGEKKYVRAHPVLAAAEAGKVYYLKDQAWNDPFLDEFDNFPQESTNEFDDQVDCLAMAYNYLTKGKKASPSWGRGYKKKGEKIQSSRIPVPVPVRDNRQVTGVVFGRRRA